MTCPRWVEPLPPPPHPKSPLVVLIPDVLALFTPVPGAAVLPARPGQPGARLEAACQDCGLRPLAELAADGSQEFGLRAEWSEPEVREGVGP